MSSPNPLSVEQLKEKARVFRIDIIKMLSQAGSGHPGGSLSAIDLITYLHYNQMGRTIENALDPERDKFIISKGHAVPALYAVLAGIGLIKYEDLMTLRHIDSPLQGHPDVCRIPYVEASTGSLGQGLSIAQGMAMTAQIDNSGAFIYVMLGDGEFQEGQIWESLLSAPKYNLGNLIVYLDYNKAQIDGFVKDVMPLEPISDKLSAFNWDVHTIDGHDFDEMHKATEAAKKVTDRPSFIIANTIKGKGVSFMEGLVGWHGKTPNPEEEKRAIQELEGQGS